MRVVMLSNGAGISANDSDATDITPSLWPVGTFQEGPPFNKTERNQYVCIRVRFMVMKYEFLR
ncbi:hypothetical protein Hanom_Chr13g01212181 [Helianthus anomalus]